MSTKNFLIIPISSELPAWVVPKEEANMWILIDCYLSIHQAYDNAYMIISEETQPDLFKYFQS